MQNSGENGAIRVRLEYESEICHIPNKQEGGVSATVFVPARFQIPVNL